MPDPREHDNPVHGMSRRGVAGAGSAEFAAECPITSSAAIEPRPVRVDFVVT
jgi:hypothetical protein